MRRFIVCLLFGSTLVLGIDAAHGQQDSGPRLKTLAVPAAQARSIATKLSIQYRDVAGVQISPDVQNERLVVMAPEKTQKKIAEDLRGLLASQIQQVGAESAGPRKFSLKNITWREFEDDLASVVGKHLPVTTSRSGERAAYQLTAKPLDGTTVEIDRRNNTVTVIAPQPALPGWQKMITALDQMPRGPGSVTELMRLKNAEPAPVQRALRLLQELESNQAEGFAAVPVDAKTGFANAVFQQGAGQDAGGQPVQDTPDGVDEEAGAGVIGDTQIQFVPELGTIIIRGSKRDVQRVMDVIKEIELKSELTKPAIEVKELQHADSNAVAALLQQLYEDVLSARQGDVSITSLDSPNALLLIGREEAIRGLLDLIAKIDQPVSESSRLRVFRLQNASAVDAEQAILDFFTDRPGSNDDIRPGIGPRVRVLADFRTNSLIISAAPRDMVEITNLINELDVHEVEARSEIKVFPLNNAIADELAPVLQEAINGEGEGTNDNLTSPATSLSILTIDSDDQQIVQSGILAGAVVTPDPGANAIVARAPSASMPLIAELIRQLDKTPGIDSLVKVFTVKNGDAAQLTASLQSLFGADASTLGTSVGAGNAGGLPSSTAGGESSLVPLTFSQDVRTNSIIASGAAEDLEVVESILLRLDSEGFAERITEVIWLRHQAAESVAASVQDYVLQRTNGVNRIQQYQQGLGPYDLGDRDLVVASHFESNSLLISVSPRLYEEVRRLIDRLDRRPPMVLIKVLLAEVRLDDVFEIGGEVGLQDSLLYNRGVAAGAFPGATAPSDPGFNFNNANTPNNNSFGQGNLAASGLSSFGVGTSNSNLGYGGFVLSAASESVSLLLRTLQDVGRAQILSRPQIMTMDNTQGFVQVGRQIARVTGVINNVSNTQVVTEDIEVGLIMQVLPRVGADGLIVMDIDATRSERDDSNGTVIPTGGVGGDTVFINDILRTTAQSTIAAYSGQTVVFGGLIQKVRANFSRRVPIVADIPLLGHFFKYDQEGEQRTELLVIMTPMLVDGDEDMEYVKKTESRRMSWCLADVVESHGDVGLSGGYGLWGPAVGATIYPDLEPTVPNARPSAIPYRSGPYEVNPRGTPGLFENAGYSTNGEYCPEPYGDESMIDSGLEPAPVTPVIPDAYQQNMLPAPSSQGSAVPPSNQSPLLPSPVVLPSGLNGALGRNYSTPNTTIGAGVTPASNATPVRANVLPVGTAAPGGGYQPQPAGQAQPKPSSFPMPPVPPPVARQVSWLDLQSEQAAPTTWNRPQPKRLGTGR